MWSLTSFIAFFQVNLKWIRNFQFNPREVRFVGFLLLLLFSCEVKNIHHLYRKKHKILCISKGKYGKLHFFSVSVKDRVFWVKFFMCEQKSSERITCMTSALHFCHLSASGTCRRQKDKMYIENEVWVNFPLIWTRFNFPLHRSSLCILCEFCCWV